MADAGRPANPVPSEVEVSGEQGTATVDPRASVLHAPNRPWRTNERGWLAFDNWEGSFGYGSYGPPYVADDEKAEMLCDPQVFAMLHLRRAWVLSEGVQITPTEGIPLMESRYIVNKRYERAVEAAELCKWMLENTSDSLHSVLMQWQQADWYRNMASDLIWRDQEWGDYKGKLMLDRMPVSGPENYLIWRDAGVIIGLQPTWGGTLYEQSYGYAKDSNGGVSKDGRPIVYPIEKFGLFMFRPGRYAPHGTDLAGVVQLPHYMKREAQPLQLENLAQFGSPFAYAMGPENVIGNVPLPTGLVDQYGEPMNAKRGDGTEIKVPPQVAMAAGLQNGLKAGGSATFPATAKVGLLEAQGDGRQFTNFFEHYDKQIAVAILCTGTLTQEQRYGSNATAQTGESTASKPAGTDQDELAWVIRQSLCVPAVRYNLPQKYWDVIPKVRLGSRDKSFWAGLLTTCMNAMPIEAAYEFVGGLMRRMGLPDDDIIRMRDMAMNREPLPGTVGVSATGGQNGTGGSGDNGSGG